MDTTDRGDWTEKYHRPWPPRTTKSVDPAATGGQRGGRTRVGPPPKGRAHLLWFVVDGSGPSGTA